jgi:transcriptional regulator with XRE-family HTH domain
MDQNGLTNYQLAKLLGCHQSNIAYWLSGDRTPRKQTQKKLAELFDVTVESLMNGNALITLGKVSLEPPLLHMGNIGPKEKPAIDVIDDDLREYLDELRNRPEKRLLFFVTKNATKSQIEAIVKMIEEMQGDQ